MKKHPSLAALAKKTGVSLSTIKRHKAAGVDVFNPSALRKHAQEQKHAPPALTSPELREAKLRKINLECEKIAFALDCERKLFVPISELTADMVRIGSTMRGELARFVGDSGNLAGLQAAEIHTRCRKWADGLCAVLADPKSYAGSK